MSPGKGNPIWEQKFKQITLKKPINLIKAAVLIAP